MTTINDTASSIPMLSNPSDKELSADSTKYMGQPEHLSAEEIRKTKNNKTSTADTQLLKTKNNVAKNSIKPLLLSPVTTATVTQITAAVKKAQNHNAQCFLEYGAIMKINSLMGRNEQLTQLEQTLYMNDELTPETRGLFNTEFNKMLQELGGLLKKYITATVDSAYASTAASEKKHTDNATVTTFSEPPISEPPKIKTTDDGSDNDKKVSLVALIVEMLIELFSAVLGVILTTILQAAQLSFDQYTKVVESSKEKINKAVAGTILGVLGGSATLFTGLGGAALGFRGVHKNKLASMDRNSATTEGDKLKDLVDGGKDGLMQKMLLDPKTAQQHNPTASSIDQKLFINEVKKHPELKKMLSTENINKKKQELAIKNKKKEISNEEAHEAIFEEQIVNNSTNREKFHKHLLEGDVKDRNLGNLYKEHVATTNKNVNAQEIFDQKVDATKTVKKTFEDHAEKNDRSSRKLSISGDTSQNTGRALNLILEGVQGMIRAQQDVIGTMQNVTSEMLSKAHQNSMTTRDAMDQNVSQLGQIMSSAAQITSSARGGA